MRAGLGASRFSERMHLEVIHRERVVQRCCLANRLDGEDHRITLEQIAAFHERHRSGIIGKDRIAVIEISLGRACRRAIHLRWHTEGPIEKVEVVNLKIQHRATDPLLAAPALCAGHVKIER